MTKYAVALAQHYRQIWRVAGRECRLDRGPVQDLPVDFHVLEHAPGPVHAFWVYATCLMSEPNEEYPIELHLFSPVKAQEHVELLYAIAHYHQTGASLGLGHTVNFGRPWLDKSICAYGLISLPYLDGPNLEHFKLAGADVACLWLIPIAEQEREFKKQHGLEALEEKLEESGFDYLNPQRTSVVGG